MNSNKNTVIDNACLHLLEHGYPVLIGMPAYGIRSCVFRGTAPLSPEDLVGLSEESPGESILDDHERLYGYQFSWGTLSEMSSEGVEDEGDIRYVDFEFAPREVYMAFPDGWHLADLFAWMYRLHPLRHGKFSPDPDGVTFDWSVLTFRARGELQINSLRTWLINVFIPLIWPDLVNEAMKIIGEKTGSVANPDELEKLLADRSRWMLCEKPKSLSFYKGR